MQFQEVSAFRIIAIPIVKLKLFDLITGNWVIHAQSKAKRLSIIVYLSSFSIWKS